MHYLDHGGWMGGSAGCYLIINKWAAEHDVDGTVKFRNQLHRFIGKKQRDIRIKRGD